MTRLIASTRQLASGALGLGLFLNGSTQHVSFGNVLSTESVVTVTMWVYVNSTPSGNYEIIFGYNNARWFFIHPGADRDFRFSFKTGGVEKAVTTTFVPDIGSWYFVTGRYDPDGGADNHRIRVYSSVGALVQQVTGTQIGAMDTSANHIRVGYDSGRGYYWDGGVDDIRIYNRFLSDEELDALALHQEPSSTGLLLHCEFNERDETTAVCKVGAAAGIAGTLIGKSNYINGIVPRRRSIAVGRAAI